MKTIRFAATLSLATFAAAASALVMSAANAGQPAPTSVDGQTSAFTSQVSVELDAKLQAVDLPAPNKVRIAEQRLHDGRFRLAAAEPTAQAISISASSSLPKLTLN